MSSINDKAKYSVGDIVQAASVYPGQKPSTQKFRILASYKNLTGWWHAAETMGGDHPGDEVALGDQGAAYVVVAHSVAEPPTSPVESFSSVDFLEKLESYLNNGLKVIRRFL